MWGKGVSDGQRCGGLTLPQSSDNHLPACVISRRSGLPSTLVLIVVVIRINEKTAPVGLLPRTA